MSKTPKYEEFLLDEEEIESRDIVRLTDIDGIDHQLSPYSVQQKLMAVTMWSVLGNMAEVSRRTGIDQNVIKYWKNHTEWWKEAIARIRLQRNEKFDAKLTAGMDRLMDEILDRVDNGDEVVLKDGSSRRRKLGGKEMALMLAMLYDKRALIRGDPTSNPGTRGGSTQEEMLKSLKSSFENLSKDIKRRDNEKIVSEQ